METTQQPASIQILQVVMTPANVLIVQQAAAHRRMLLPDFISSALIETATEILSRADVVKDEDFRQTHRRGRREGQAARLTDSVKVLHDAGHHEAAEFLTHQFDPAANRVEPKNADAATRVMTRDDAMQALREDR